ncbi:hypothetical protein [Mycetocola zhadangensis]|uniref:hypothetical protein n=1 Tax=Mycetocola zhadangensis TaxID=1164595 RepID=UPI0016016B3A|nr:hypothetical protein [Mycetocola zhadangensis]
MGGIGIVLCFLQLWVIGAALIAGGVALFIYAQRLRRLPYQTPSDSDDREVS